MPGKFCGTSVLLPPLALFVGVNNGVLSVLLSNIFLQLSNTKVDNFFEEKKDVTVVEAV